MSVVLVTGSCGLVGSESVKFFSSKGFDIIGIDNNSRFNFFGKEDSAWTSDKDKEVIFAMKKGITLIVEGYSSRGTLTVDTYTLKGFTAGFNKLSKDC